MKKKCLEKIYKEREKYNRNVQKKEALREAFNVE